MENAKWRLIIIHQGTTIVSWKIGRQSWDDNFLIAQIFWPDFSLQKWKMSGNVWGSSTYVCAGATTIPRVSWSYHVWTKLFFYEFCPCTSFPTTTTTHPWAMERFFFFFCDYRYITDTYNARTLTSTYTRMQTLSLWASLKIDSANPRDWQSHHRHLAVDGNVAYHFLTGSRTRTYGATEALIIITRL